MQIHSIGDAIAPQTSGMIGMDGGDAALSRDVQQSGGSVAESAGRDPALEEIQAEIKDLAKQLCGNDRVAAKYRGDKKKILAFLNVIGKIGASEIRATGSSQQIAPSGEEVETSPPERLTFTRTVEQICQASGLAAFEVDKYLRWATKGLEILECEIPKDNKVRDRAITMDYRTMQDLDYLLDPAKRVGLWDLPVEVAVNGFKYKSLSNFALNVAIGCFFGCLFCYVPSASTLSLGWRLLRFGILDADAEWGTYCLIRRWDEDHFRKSLRRLLAIPPSELAPDGHMAIMMCTNTDPYQPVFHPDPVIRKKLQEYLRMVVRRCLEVLLEPEFSRFKVRIQTRGLDVENDFDVMKKFGNRLLLGMSIPTLNNTLAKVYEPKAPAPTRRLEEVLAKAIKMGIPCYVAMAPTFPECDEADIRRTLTAFARLPFHTIFHEAINARAKNVDRIVEEAHRRKMPTKAEVVRHKKTRIPYAIAQMQLVERIAIELGIGDKVHLWPDAELLDEKIINAQPDPDEFRAWLLRYHGRISEWPGENGPRSYNPYPAKDITVEIEDAAILSSADKEFLAKEEATIDRGIRTFLDVAAALARIRDYRNGILYRQYASFEEYCRQRWDFGPSYTHRLLDAAHVVEILPMGKNEAKPTNERQVRALCLLAEPEDQRAAWKQALKNAGEGPVTGKIVQTAVCNMIDAGAKRKTAERKTGKVQSMDAEVATGNVQALGNCESGLKTKSIHSPMETGDGLRILTSRFRGRGIPKDRCDVWMPNLGPSEPLLKRWKAGRIDWTDYVREYKDELFTSDEIDARNETIKNHGQKFTLRLIKELAKRQSVTLLCQCPEEELHCHRHVLHKLIISNAI